MVRLDEIGAYHIRWGRRMSCGLLCRESWIVNPKRFVNAPSCSLLGGLMVKDEHLCSSRFPECRVHRAGQRLE